jgi:hypothetical protein
MKKLKREELTEDLSVGRRKGGSFIVRRKIYNIAKVKKSCFAWNNKKDYQQMMRMLMKIKALLAENYKI